MNKLFKFNFLIILLLVCVCAFTSCAHGVEKLKEGSDFKILSSATFRKEKVNKTLDESEKSYFNNFAYDTFINLYKDDSKNLVYSPASFFVAMSMLTEGANGETLNELNEFLKVNDVSGLRKISDALSGANNYENDEGKARLANSYWVDYDLEIKDEYVNNLLSYYNAEGFSCEFNDNTKSNIVKWMNNNTYHFLNMKEKDIEFSKDLVLMLINSLYFENKWSVEYKKNDTREQNFNMGSNAVSASFMHHKVYNKYFEGTNFVCAYDTFKNDNKIVYVLPNEGVSIKDILEDKELKDVMLNDIAWDYYTISYSLPKFNYKCKLNLKDLAQEMGLDLPFEPFDADLTKIAQSANYNLYVSKIVQNVRIMVDEQGAKAAAITSIHVNKATAAFEEIVSMVLDRPFLYYILDSNDNIIFMGVINNPTLE